MRSARGRAKVALAVRHVEEATIAAHRARNALRGVKGRPHDPQGAEALAACWRQLHDALDSLRYARNQLRVLKGDDDDA